MRCFLLGLLMGCKGSDPILHDTTDTAAPADTADTSDSADSADTADTADVVVVTYAGSAVLTGTFAGGSDTCSGTITLRITGDVNAAGNLSCTWAGALAGAVVQGTLDGSAESAVLSGTFGLESLFGTWSGQYDAASLSGSLAGEGDWGERPLQVSGVFEATVE